MSVILTLLWTIFISGCNGNWQDFACHPEQFTCDIETPPLLLLSYDGFRAEYLLEHVTPNIQTLFDCGTHAPYMYPSFPSITFPNHYAIVTGLFPESHGIIDNDMYDPTLNQSFTVQNHDPIWWQGEPMWNTVQKVGKKSATYFWPGADIEIGGMYPNYYFPYDSSVPYPDRIQQVIDWLKLPDAERPAFLTLYFFQPDHFAHQYGPNSTNVTEELKIVDGYVNDLMTALYDNGFFQCINVIMVADHGFTTTPLAEQIYLEDEINVEGLKVFKGPNARVMWEPYWETDYKNVQEIEDALVCKSDLYKVYSRSEMPTRLHYSISERIGDVIVQGDLHHFVLPSRNISYVKIGSHGFDFRIPQMHTIFIAHGPSIKANYTVASFQNVELYNLMLDLMEIPEGAPNNGTKGSLHQVMRHPPNLPSDHFQTEFGSCQMDATFAQVCLNCQEFINWSDFNLPGSNCKNEPTNLENLIPKLPLGSVVQDEEVCILVNCDSVIQYNTALKSAVAITIPITGDFVPIVFSEDCTYLDPRIHTDSCTDYDRIPEEFVMTSVFMTEYEAYLSTAKFPMHRSFSEGAFSYIVATYLAQFKTDLLYFGPVFDNNHDGLADSQSEIRGNGKYANSFPIPTSFYIVLLSCADLVGQSKCANPKAMSFILPNRKQVINSCRFEVGSRDYLYENTARVRDVELVTGLQFFDGIMEQRESIMLRSQVHQWL